MTGKHKNERKLCDAIARVLEARAGSQRQNPRCPEKDRVGPPVDYAFDLAGRTVVLEHTVIEAFDGQIQTGVDFAKFAHPIQRELDEAMPTPGVYHLSFPLEPTAGVHRRNHARVRTEIVAWALAAAAELRDEAPFRKDRHQAPYGHQGRRDTIIEGIPLSLTREVRWTLSGRFDGRLFLQRVMQGDQKQIQQLRLARMATALAKKLPKLVILPP